MGEGAIEQGAPAAADGGSLALGLGVLAVQHAAQDLRGVVPFEGQMPDHALVEKDAHPEHVGARVHLAAFDLFGGHVRGASEDLPRRGDALRVEQLGDPEVSQLDDDAIVAPVSTGLLGGHAIGAGGGGAMLDQDVFGLDVAVHDAARVGVGDGAEQVEADGGGDLRRHRATALEELAESGSANQLDDEVLVGLVGLADVEDLDDVGVMQLGDGFGFRVEARHDLAAEVAQGGGG